VAQPEPAPGYAGLRLDPAAPNPFGARTEIVFALSDPGNIRLRVYDVSGREVARLADERLPAGRHLRSWDGRGARGQQVASGIYFLRLEHAGRVTSRKVVLAR
jgi:flagellar hook assembly protein FlgD